LTCGRRGSVKYDINLRTATATTLSVFLRSFVPDLDRHLAACDPALVQGGLTTCMELAAAGTPFIYFPLKNHFEQNFHVAHRLDRYRGGRRMEFATSTLDMIAEAMVGELRAARWFDPVEAEGFIKARARSAPRGRRIAFGCLTLNWLRGATLQAARGKLSQGRPLWCRFEIRHLFDLPGQTLIPAAKCNPWW
jgi:hypothetical protein